MNGEARMDTGHPHSRSIAVASALFLINGVAWGLGTIPYALYIHRLGELPTTVGGIESMSGPISRRFGHDAVVWLLVPLAFASWLEVLAGYWLRKSRKEGGWLAIFLLPITMFFWIGFVMPIWLVLGPLIVLLVLAGWKSLR